MRGAFDFLFGFMENELKWNEFGVKKVYIDVINESKTTPLQFN